MSSGFLKAAKPQAFLASEPLQHNQHHQQDTVLNVRLTLSLPFSQQFNCTLRAGEVGVLLAPSGAGKTTLFNALVGLHHANGSIKVGVTQQEQQRLKVHQRQLAYVTQKPVLFGHVTVRALINLVAKQQLQAFDVSWAIEPLKLSESLSLRATQLSGGQQQRLSLLLAMIKGTPVLLLDEVLTGLDHASKQATIAVIKRYLALQGAVALIACHQLEDALALADVAFVQSQDGEQKQWIEMPIGAGIHQYQLQNLMGKLAQPLDEHSVCASQFVSLLSVKTVAHHTALGLTEYSLAGQSCFSALKSHLTPNEHTTLILRANRVGLAKTALVQSSFVNQWSVTIVDIRPVSWQGEQGMLIDTQILVRDDMQTHDRLSVWITRLSFNQLQPKEGQHWYLISKADAVSSTYSS